ncbi:MAG: CotH kinase family protein [Clostridiales bacterium]|jgi:hypothetical protein|nr:CotH kinase family protein [Clostridiales bacterium]
MSKHKYTNIVCVMIVLATLAVAIAFVYSPNLGVVAVHAAPEYVSALFGADKVHTIDIQVKESDWNDMIANAQAEEYIQVTVVIDGEKVSGVGLRPKGNSSLSMIATSDSDRYSFKIEFGHYSKNVSYHGLDKLALNNIAQDNTYMKDYAVYQMMNEMGADAPLSSFIQVTVNDNDWGLYLAVEGIEESFARRVYGNDFGDIYKPDSMDMGGERGGGAFPGGGRRPGLENGEAPNFSGENDEIPNWGNLPDFSSGETRRIPGFGGGRDGDIPDFASGQDGNMPGFAGGRDGMSGGASLVYSDDNPDSYSAIFDNAVFKASEADKTRLIESLKQLNAGENIEQVVDVDEVIRYFVVHNFALNSDSYTGSMTHNYYLAENDGQLSMIAWDYNLAFGGMGGNTSETAADAATALVNYPIDSPMLSGSIDDKPMIAWIFSNEEYLARYHQIYAEYMEYFTSGKFSGMYDNAIALISPYIEKDSSAFCTREEFQKGSAALREFCLLRAKSISGQLDGVIASTSDGQTDAGSAHFVDASGIDIASMGSNSMGFGRARGSRRFPGRNRYNDGNAGFVPDNSINSEETATLWTTAAQSG